MRRLLSRVNAAAPTIAARLVADRRHRDRDVDPAPVLGHPLGVDLADHPARAHGGQQAARSAATFRRHEHGDRRPERLLRGIAVETRGRGVPVRDQPVQREADDRVLRGLDERRHAVQRGGRLAQVRVGLQTPGEPPSATRGSERPMLGSSVQAAGGLNLQPPLCVPGARPRRRPPAPRPSPPAPRRRAAGARRPGAAAARRASGSSRAAARSRPGSARPGSRGG